MDEQRNVTPSEDSMLRAAARRSAKVVSQGRMTMDELPPLPDDDRAIIELARKHAPVVYTNRHFPDTPAFSFPTRKLLDFARAYAAAAVERAEAKAVKQMLEFTQRSIEDAVALEREKCAKVCEAYGRNVTTKACAAAIRGA